MKFKRCIMVLADGARPDVLYDEMQQGNLPNLAKLSEAGTRATMLSAFPSTTGPAYLPYMTGCFPGTCNIPGIRWFDKPAYAKHGWGYKSFRSYCGIEAYAFDSDMRPEIKTMWEIFDNPKSVFNGVNKGLKKQFNSTFVTRSTLFYYAHLTDRWHFVDHNAYRYLSNIIKKRDFDFSFIVYPSVDEISHRSSPFHPKVREAYRVIDGLVGEMVADLKTAGIYDETLIVLVSDHGLSETKTHFDVGPWLEEQKKIRTLYYTNIFKFKFDAACMISGNGMANLYFGKGESWGRRQSFEELSHTSLLLDELRFRPEIDLVTTQGADGSIHFQTERGHGRFRYSEQDKLVRYDFDRDDPLAVFKKGEADVVNGFTFDRAMERTFDSHYPDVFMQMHQLFHSPRTGDVVLSAKTGNDLREKFEHPIHKASHGAICPEHMKIPLIMNYPTSQKFIRSVDVMPTILSLLGKEIPAGIEGKPLS